MVRVIKPERFKATIECGFLCARDVTVMHVLRVHCCALVANKGEGEGKGRGERGDFTQKYGFSRFHVSG